MNNSYQISMGGSSVVHKLRKEFIQNHKDDLDHSLADM